MALATPRQTAQIRDLEARLKDYRLVHLGTQDYGASIQAQKDGRVCAEVAMGPVVSEGAVEDYICTLERLARGLKKTEPETVTA